MSKEAFRIDGRVALVTGASRGLGAEIAQTLAAQGAKVVVNYHQNESAARKVVSAIEERGGTAVAMQADILNEEACAILVEAVHSEFGTLDILVLNATPPQKMERLEDYDAEHHRSMLDAFVMSPFYLTRSALPSMKSEGWGRIINITSEVIDNGITEYSAYVAAKGGQHAWTRTMARELAPFGITVNNVAPGWIPVERHSEDPVEAMEAYTSRVPAGRMGTPKDIANAVVYFASDEANFVNGQSLSVNGANTTG
jgi:3-oxoacyl-[acyl-carrier protein] reductase